MGLQSLLKTLKPLEQRPNDGLGDLKCCCCSRSYLAQQLPCSLQRPEAEEQTSIARIRETVEAKGDAPYTKTHKVRVQFDVGSERSFIAEEVVQQLGTEAAYKETLIVDGFDGMHTMRCTSARLKLKMKRNEGQLFIMFMN